MARGPSRGSLRPGTLDWVFQALRSGAIFLILASFLLASPSAWAQQQKAGLFAGYQFTRFARVDSRASDTLNANGWNAALAYHFNDRLGIKGDFSGAYVTDLSANQNNGAVSLLTYAAGPVLSAPSSSKVTPFAEVLLGGYHESLPVAGSNGVALLAGGGADARINDRFSIRVFDLDWLRFVTASCAGVSCRGANNLRFSAGVIIHF